MGVDGLSLMFDGLEETDAKALLCVCVDYVAEKCGMNPIDLIRELTSVIEKVNKEYGKMFEEDA